MLFFVLFLVGFYTQTAQGQALPIPDFACGYFKEISNGALSLAAPPGVAGRWFESKRTNLASYDINSSADCASQRYPALRDFSEEVIAAADGFIDFSAHDGDGRFGVDLVSLVIPQEFGETCGFSGTIFDITK